LMTVTAWYTQLITTSLRLFPAGIIMRNDHTGVQVRSGPAALHRTQKCCTFLRRLTQR